MIEEAAARIARIEVDPRNDVTFYFGGSEEPFNAGEFSRESQTGKVLRHIELFIIDYNEGRNNVLHP